MTSSPLSPPPEPGSHPDATAAPDVPVNQEPDQPMDESRPTQPVRPPAPRTSSTPPPPCAICPAAPGTAPSS